jgi:hypothetical protein
MRIGKPLRYIPVSFDYVQDHRHLRRQPPRVTFSNMVECHEQE